MSKVLVDKSMSLDGFVTGPNVSVKHPMGEFGERLHQWLFNEPEAEPDSAVAREMHRSTGAVVLGRRIFDVGIGEWEDTPYPVPSFVVTHRGQDDLVQKSGTFSFVTGGIECALQSLFGDLQGRLHLELLSTSSFASGAVLHCYQPAQRQPS